MSLRNLVAQTIDGKYLIEREIGKGGMGTVYLATHIGTERPVAVKIIAPQFMQRAEFVERFRREARAAGRLRHPNVVDVTDFGFSETKDGKVAYLVMEYLDGCTLGEILEEEKTLPLAWSLDILEQVCSAVDEAHKQGIIHRDLKPDNIWLEPNQRGGYTVKVLDFGIAKLEEQSHEIDGLPSISSSKTEEFRGSETVADQNQSATMAEGAQSTQIFDKHTLVQNDDQGTLVSVNENATLVVAENSTLAFNSEGGTLVQHSDPIDDEGGTAILPKSPTIIDENDGTKILTVQDITKQTPAQPTANLTRVGAVLGTPLYMSPEQCRGHKLDTRSDIYSLGVIAYQMLGGKTPFEGDFTSVMKAHQESEPPILNVKKTPAKVKRTIFAALAKDVANRPQTAEAFASELRSHSEGIGVLFRRAITIYGEHLPKFLKLAFLLAIPMILFNLAKIAVDVLVATEVLSNNYFWMFARVSLGFVDFFAKIFYAALLVGTTTWIIAQVLAVPLRPVNLKSALDETKKRWKPLIKTVTVSTLISIVGLALCLIPGFFLSAIYMLVAPSIMMEGLRGRMAFRRSFQLVKRSFPTVLATCLIVYFVPGILAIVISLSIQSIVGGPRFFKPDTTTQTTQTAEKANDDVEETDDEKSDDVKTNNIKVDIGPNGVKISDDDQKAETEEKKIKVFRSKIGASIFEFIWIPIVVLFSSFTSVITALIYFKTRQAGGESMADLLEQFEETERPRSKWQTRVRDRLEQSGRVTSKT